ncbi:hypothetical protein BDQ17DRAFT_233356 [Cyathus striatus]|nr:hypothetical protein BDQ17DRAFT_233356 [Cyathus striatus]
MEPNTSTEIAMSSSIVGLQIPSMTTTSFPYTITTTKVVTSALPGGGETTYTTVIQTGVLSTDVPRGNPFAHNTRAIIGLSLGITAFLILSVIAIFFTCRRFKRQRSRHGSEENFLDPFSGPVWRPPLVDDDGEHENVYEVRHRHSAPRFAVGGTSADHSQSLSHSGEGEEGSNGSADGYIPIPGSVESAGGRPGLVRNASSGQGTMQGFGQTMGMNSNAMNVSMAATAAAAGLSHRMSSTSHARRRRQSSVAPEPGLWLGGRDIASTSVYDSPQAENSSSLGHGWVGSRTSLVHAHESSLGHGGGSSSGHGVSRPTSVGHVNVNSFYPLPPLPGMSQSGEIQMPDVLVHLPTAHPSLEELQPLPSSSTTSPRASYNPYTMGPSSLLHPIPPSVQGSTAHLSPLTMSQTLWPPATLPVYLSPASEMTETSSLAEGLLNPHLGVAGGVGMNEAMQASVTSLRDNIDYTRPINPRLHSSATFFTVDSASAQSYRDEDGEDGRGDQTETER